jgi:hypothetical protein
MRFDHVWRYGTTLLASLSVAVRRCSRRHVINQYSGSVQIAHGGESSFVRCCLAERTAYRGRLLLIAFRLGSKVKQQVPLNCQNPALKRTDADYYWHDLIRNCFCHALRDYRLLDYCAPQAAAKTPVSLAGARIRTGLTDADIAKAYEMRR